MYRYFRFHRHFLIAGVIFLILAGGAFYFLDFQRGGKEFVVTVESPTPAFVDKAGGKSQSVTPPLTAAGGAAKMLTQYQGEPITKLNADPNVVASVGAALVEKYQKNLDDIAKRISQNSVVYDDWLGVAYIKKLFHNYVGTRDALEYAKVVNPQSPIAYFNLGELYGYELKNPVKAEENYLSALRLDPHSLDYYAGLANFYEDVLKDMKKAENILLAALEPGNIPQTEVNLFTTIGAFYRNQGNYTKAIEYFEKALGITKDSAIQKSIQSEIDYIRSKSEIQP